jgi:nicotinate phosphoribosyltransferase
VSQDPGKVTIPGKKEAYRLFDSTDRPILDVMIMSGSSIPTAGKKILCRNPFDEKKRCFVTPSRVESLHELVWDGKLLAELPTLTQIRDRCQMQLMNLREDHLRRLNPTPYKVSISSDLYTFMHDLWLAEAPVPELS